LSPLLICCFCCTSLHLDHTVNPCSPRGDFIVPIKPNIPNLLSSQSSHYPLQDPAVFKSLTIYIHLLRTGDTPLSSSYQDPYNYYTPPTAPLISLPSFPSLHQPNQHTSKPPPVPIVLHSSWIPQILKDTCTTFFRKS
jgi:hypothetical protein